MSNPAWVVKNVEAHSDYTLLLTFENGEEKVYNARPLLSKEIYAPLRSLPFFLQAKAFCGTVTWNDDIDIAPEHLYDASTPVR